MQHLRRCGSSLGSHGIIQSTLSRAFVNGIHEPKPLDLTFLDDIFRSESKDRIQHSYDVILLNAPSNGLIPNLCRNANTVICADGGANSLFESMGNSSQFIPNAIVGDLDSIKPKVLDYFAERGTDRALVEDQNRNDFQKSLQYLLDQHTASEWIICWGAFGDRFDHEMQSMNVLYKYYQRYHGVDSSDLESAKSIVLMTDRNFGMLLTPGRYRIECAQLQGPLCSVIPLYSPLVTVTTKGLKYDMDQTVLEFGGLLSTSNAFKDETHCIEIECDKSVLFHTTCSF